MDIKEQILKTLADNFTDTGIESSEFRGDLTLKLPAADAHKILAFLKASVELDFVKCDDITVIDWAARQNRFSMVYNLFSLKHSFRLRIMVPVNDKTLTVETVADIWKSADWYEREAYDMYGISFSGHPDLRRMYMPEEFEYHPLRKEFPVMGIPGSIPLPKK